MQQRVFVDDRERCCATMSDSKDVVEETCEELDTQTTDSHWVESLFPPTFSLSLQEPVHVGIKTAIQDRRGRELPAESATCDVSEELFVKLGGRISPIDVAAVKNVYQRVWLMMNTNESARCKYTTQWLYLIQNTAGHQSVLENR